MLVGVVDPLTAASTTGDTRGFAAALTATTALILLVLLHRAGVRPFVAVLLCLGLAGTELFVSANASVSYALLSLIGALMLLVWWNHVPHAKGRTGAAARLSALAALTVIGSLVHPAFSAFSSAVWAAEILYPPAFARWQVATIAGGTLALAIGGGGWMLVRNVDSMTFVAVDAPTVWTTAQALISGQFPESLQPQRDGSLRDALAAIVPGTLIVYLTLAAAASLRRDTRALFMVSLCAITALLMFSGRTWLPDVEVAAGAARPAVLLIAGLGVSWLWNWGPGASRLVAVAASALLGAWPYAASDPFTRIDATQMQAFVDVAHTNIGTSLWSADRLATARAMLLRNGVTELGMRIHLNGKTIDELDETQRHVILGEEHLALGPGVWHISGGAGYPSAGSFLAAQRPGVWLTIAVGGRIDPGFCSELLEALGVSAEPTSADVAVLARIGGGAVARSRELQAEYGETVAGSLSPARFEIRTHPAAAISVNGETAGVTEGMVIAVFDPLRMALRPWLVGNCGSPEPPPIADPRLRIGYALPVPAATSMPQVPIVGRRPVSVTLGQAGRGWFGEGWHQPDSDGPDAMRWTGAPEAHVHVAVSHRQTLRIRVDAGLAETSPEMNRMHLTWNGSSIVPTAVAADGTGEWIVPSSLVRKGLNRLTLHVRELVVPSLRGASTDTRRLGIAVRRILISPDEIR
jgi:hypothetical protein